ncbi:MAG: lysophospholipid acyltransferase family protein [Syntrophales bacterium]
MVKYLSKLAINCGLIPAAYYLIRLYFLLVRVRIINESYLLEHLEGGKRAIIALWHQRIFLSMSYAKRLGAFSPAVMISESRDGEIIARILSHVNFRPVRGSSSHHGRKALAAMVADMVHHKLAAHILDGPRGPRGIVKAGLITMAQLSGAAILPLYASVNRAWVLKSWDRFLIPKPFSHVLLRWDQPLYIPQHSDAEEFEAIRLQMEKQLRESQEGDDRRFGWTESLL